MILRPPRSTRTDPLFPYTTLFRSILLTHVAEGRLSLGRFVVLPSAWPARIYGIAGKGRIARGFDADFTVVDLAARRTITDDWIRSRSAWTPYDGVEVNGWPVMTIVRGCVAMRDDELLGAPSGRPVRFLECLAAA